ncbi:MAG: flagellar protein FlaF [Candidatus Tokpelaia sp. JSC189]|nr:MAG: flagellar protein FlaF [Candidatus Tokpelaia sp. JSC189]
MYRMRYKDTIEESVQNVREHEAALFNRCVKLLQAAQKAGLKTPEVLDAVIFIRKLWSVLIKDLGQEVNVFSGEMKASLISIGFFFLKEIDRLEKGEEIDFDTLIEISHSIRDGLTIPKIGS